MSFTLRWKNDNPAGSIVKIYRGSAKLNPGALPAPLATLTNGETAWEDTTVVLNNTYYYILGVTVNGRTVLGPQKSIKVINRRGVGNVFIYYDDNDELGYMGTMTFEEQFTYNCFPAGFRSLTGLTGDVQAPCMKFTRHGRIFYMLSGTRPVSTLFTWNDIYNAGLVYGVDGPGPATGRGALAPVDQSGLFTWQGDTYRMRLMRGLTEGPIGDAMIDLSAFNGLQHDATAFGDCEYNDLIYPRCEWVPLKQRVCNWEQNTPNNLFGSGAANNLKTVLCQEHDPVTGKVLGRGNALTSAVGTLEQLQSIYVIDPTVTGIFIPIIELME